MMQRIKSTLTALLMAGGLLMPTLAVAPAYASVQASKTAACNAIGLAGDGGCNGGADSHVNSLVINIVQILTYVVGIVAVIMIIIAGFRYITSGGDSNKIAAAKNTIIYAAIGLVVVALAQTIVHFVIGQAKV